MRPKVETGYDNLVLTETWAQLSKAYRHKNGINKSFNDIKLILSFCTLNLSGGFQQR